MPPISFVLVFVVLTVLAIWLDAVRAAIAALSGGLIRKTEETNPDLANTLSEWLDARKEYSFVIRALAFTSAVFLVIVADNFFIEDKIDRFTTTEELTAFVLTIAIYMTAKELLGTFALARKQITLLKFSIPIINTFRFVLKPYLWLIMLITTSLESDSQNENTQSKASTEDEILSLVDKEETSSGDDLALEDDERRMIKGIFDLDDTPVKEVMTPRVDVVAINKDSSLDDLIELFVTSTFSRIPVYEESVDKVVGVVYAKDFLDYKKVSKLKNFKSLIHKPVFVPKTKSLDELLEEFQKEKKHFAVVLDEYGGTSGIVTIEDILEEIVGEIQDEYDEEEEVILFNVEDSGEIVADARTTISDLNDVLENKLPEEENYDTIGGYIYSVIGKIPVAGEVIELYNYQAEILEADDRQITKLKLVRHEREAHIA